MSSSAIERIRLKGGCAPLDDKVDCARGGAGADGSLAWPSKRLFDELAVVAPLGLLALLVTVVGPLDPLAFLSAIAEIPGTPAFFSLVAASAGVTAAVSRAR